MPAGIEGDDMVTLCEQLPCRATPGVTSLAAAVHEDYGRGLRVASDIGDE